MIKGIEQLQKCESLFKDVAAPNRILNRQNQCHVETFEGNSGLSKALDHPLIPSNLEVPAENTEASLVGPVQESGRDVHTKLRSVELKSGSVESFGHSLRDETGVRPQRLYRMRYPP